MSPDCKLLESFETCERLLGTDLKEVETKYGFKFWSVLCGIMHLGIWTRPDLLPATIMLSLYQASPSRPHFDALKDLAKYLRSHIDTPLVFRCTKCPKIPRNRGLDSSLRAKVSMLFVYTTHDSPFGETTMPSGPVGPIDHAFMASVQAIPKNDAVPPHTEAYADASFGTHLFDKKNFTGGLVMMDGTAVHYICRHQATGSENSTLAKIYAVFEIGKDIQWIRLMMLDLGIPYQGPVPVGEDDSATHLIAHGGKVSRNVNHVAVQMLAIQCLVDIGAAALREVGSAQNPADHFTKILPGPAMFKHTSEMMGLRFLTPLHMKEVIHQNQAG